MTRDTLSETIGSVINTLQNARKAVEQTSIPEHYIINYIKEESGIDIIEINNILISKATGKG